MRRPDGGRGVGGVGAEGPGAEADAEEADNLARLAHLTQDTVLRALRLRFDKRLIYVRWPRGVHSTQLQIWRAQQGEDGMWVCIGAAAGHAG